MREIRSEDDSAHAQTRRERRKPETGYFTSLVVQKPCAGSASKMSGGGGLLRPVTPPSWLGGPNGHRRLVPSSWQQRGPGLTPPDKIRQHSHGDDGDSDDGEDLRAPIGSLGWRVDSLQLLLL